MRLVVYSRFGLRFASHGPRIRSARAPALLAFSSAVGWVSGVRFDGEPPRVSVCISEAVRPRDEVLPQGNADVPSETAAGGFSFFDSIALAFFLLLARWSQSSEVHTTPCALSLASGYLS